MDNINDPADVSKKVTQLKLEKPSRYGFIHSKIQEEKIDIEDLEQRARQKSVISPANKEESEFLSYLNELDLIECWNPGSHRSKYQINTPEVVKQFTEHMETHEGLRWNKATVAGSLKAVAETVLEEGENLAAHKMDEIKGVPGTDSIKTHYGSWNNALLQSGITLNKEEMAFEDVRAAYRRKAYELGRPSEMEELTKNTCVTDRKIYNIVERYQELQTELPPHIREDGYSEEGQESLAFAGPISSQPNYPNPQKDGRTAVSGAD